MEKNHLLLSPASVDQCWSALQTLRHVTLPPVNSYCTLCLIDTLIQAYFHLLFSDEIVPLLTFERRWKFSGPSGKPFLIAAIYRYYSYHIRLVWKWLMTVLEWNVSPNYWLWLQQSLMLPLLPHTEWHLAQRLLVLHWTVIVLHYVSRNV